MWKGLLGWGGDRTDSFMVVLPSNHIAYIPDCRFELSDKESDAEFACWGDGDGKWLWFLPEETLPKPFRGEIEWGW